MNIFWVAVLTLSCLTSDFEESTKEQCIPNKQMLLKRMKNPIAPCAQLVMIIIVNVYGNSTKWMQIMLQRGAMVAQQI